MPTTDCPQCYWNGGIEDVGLPPPPGTHDPSKCPKKAPAAPPRPCPGVGVMGREYHDENGMSVPVAKHLHCPGCPTHAPHASEAGRLTVEEREWVETTRALVARIAAPTHTMHAAYLAQMVRIIDRLTKEQP